MCPTYSITCKITDDERLVELTAALWDPTEEVDSESDDVFESDLVAVDRHVAFPHLDVEMYWSESEELLFRVHLKPNQELRHLDRGSVHRASSLEAVPQGVFTRLTSDVSRRRLTTTEVQGWTSSTLSTQLHSKCLSCLWCRCCCWSPFWLAPLCTLAQREPPCSCALRLARRRCYFISPLAFALCLPKGHVDSSLASVARLCRPRVDSPLCLSTSVDSHAGSSVEASEWILDTMSGAEHLIFASGRVAG